MKRAAAKHQLEDNRSRSYLRHHVAELAPAHEIAQEVAGYYAATIG